MWRITEARINGNESNCTEIKAVSLSSYSPVPDQSSVLRHPVSVQIGGVKVMVNGDAAP